MRMARNLRVLPILPHRHFKDLTHTLFGYTQIFGIMPRTLAARIYALIVVTLIFLLCITSVFTRIVTYGFKIAKISPFIFHAVNGMVLAKMIHISYHWTRIMKEWKVVEDKLADEKTVNARNVKITVIVVLIIAVVEHVLSIISHIFSVLMCPDPKQSFIESFFRAHLSFIFEAVDYNLWLALFIKWIDIISTLTWSFMDLFIMIVAMGLTNLFKVFNERLFRLCRLEMPEIFWGEERRRYREICDLVEKVDDNVNFLIMISFSNNLFFICLQLLNSIVEKPTSHAIYFWFSLLYLMVRTTLVTITCSQIKEEAKRPLIALRHIPTSTWNTEIRRFAEEIGSTDICLTGKKFFKVTRGLLLAVARTIITYELILFNFDQDNDLFSGCLNQENLKNVTKKISSKS